LHSLCGYSRMREEVRAWKFLRCEAVDLLSVQFISVRQVLVLTQFLFSGFVMIKCVSYVR
jgi:hypothetical protein